MLHRIGETDTIAHAKPHRTTQAPRRSRRLAVSLVLATVLALVAVGAITGLLTAFGASNDPAGPGQSFATVTRGTLEESVPAVGTLAAARSVDVGAQVSGRIVALHVGLGDEVEEGQLIAEIDQGVYRTALDAAEAQRDQLTAQLAGAEAQLTLARSAFERQSSLSASGAATQSTLETATADLAAAQASVSGLEAQLRERQSDLRTAEVNLGYTTIHAPFAGTVVAQTVEEGQTLSASQEAPTVVTLADLTRMTVNADVSEADVARLTPGMNAWFSTLGDPATRWEGRLRIVSPTPVIENNVVLYQSRFEVDNPDRALMIGMTTQVFFLVAEARDVVTVPIAALREADGSTSVLVRTASGVEPRTVETGLRTRALAEIRSGLAEGEEVVIGAARPSAAEQPRGVPGGARP